jgi:hypothetical protein
MADDDGSRVDNDIFDETNADDDDNTDGGNESDQQDDEEDDKDEDAQAISDPEATKMMISLLDGQDDVENSSNMVQYKGTQVRRETAIVMEHMVDKMKSH